MVTAPTPEFTEHKQGDSGTNPDQKTPGKKIVGDLVVEVLVPLNGGDGALWEAFQSAGTLQRSIYAGDGFVMEVDQNGIPQNTFQVIDAWIKKIETSNYDRRGDNSADLLRTVTISVKDWIRV